MIIQELIAHLQSFPETAEIKCGIRIPTLYINTVANLSISGDHVDPTKCTMIRIITAAPEVRPPNEAQA